MSSFTRRRLLKSAAWMGLLAPVLRLRDARSADPTAPRRLILMFSPNGPMVAAGPATGAETNFQLHDWWSPLERHKADGIFFSHLCPTGSGVVPGPNDGGHAAGHGLGGQTFAGFGTMMSDQYQSAGESIDQTIGKRLEAENRAGHLRSLTWSLEETGSSVFWADAGHAISPESNPSRAWASIFGGPGAPDPAALLREKSILDFAAQDCSGLRDLLGAEGMRLLDDHCTTIRAMEKNVGDALTCATPADPGASDWTNPDRIEAQMAAFTELMALALVCEASHVVAFQFGGMAARLRIAAHYNVPSSAVVDSGDSGPAHHPWTHNPLSDPNTHLTMSIFMRFYAAQVALLVDKLKSTQDTSGRSLLDSTALLWISELGGHEENQYDGHICSSVPAVLIASAHSGFRLGRYIRGPSANTGDPGNVEGGRMTAQLMISMMHHMGLTDVMRLGATDAAGPLELLYR